MRIELLALPKAVPELRRQVRDHLGAPCPEVQLCVSELLANVITHLGEGTPVTVHVTPTRVAVTDPSPTLAPLIAATGPYAESGRGLALLGAVSLRWGVDVRPDGKTIWCQLPQGLCAGPQAREVGG